MASTILADARRRALLLALVACSPESGGDRSILVVTLDTTRADHVGAYGHPADITPNLDALAGRGVLFENAYAPMPQTLPSHATLFTGLDPRQHGALENTYTLADDHVTFAERAVARGYATGAFIGALVLDRETGIDQGFEEFDVPGGRWNPERKGRPPERPADAVTDAALAWADTLDADRPFLLWAHYYDPHDDYKAPAEHVEAIFLDAVRGLSRNIDGPLPPHELAELWRDYAAEVRFADEQMGRLIEGLEARGLMDDTAIVVVGDHGEGLWEHGLKTHGTHLWESVMRVPLVFVDPSSEDAGTRLSARATLRDVEPTLARMAWGEPGGIDLRAPREGAVFVERPHFDEERLAWRGGGQLAYGFLAAVLADEHKLVREPDGTVHLYHVTADPAELHDIAAREPDLRAQLEGLLDDWMAAHPTGMPGEAVELSDERRRALEQLGYIGADR